MCFLGNIYQSYFCQFCSIKYVILIYILFIVVFTLSLIYRATPMLDTRFISCFKVNKMCILLTVEPDTRK